MSKPDAISYQQIPNPANVSPERGRPADLTPLEPLPDPQEVWRHVNAQPASDVPDEAAQLAWNLMGHEPSEVESTLQHLEGSDEPKSRALAAWYRRQIAGARASQPDSDPVGRQVLHGQKDETAPTATQADHGYGNEQEPFNFENGEVLAPAGVGYRDRRRSSIPQQAAPSPAPVGAGESSPQGSASARSAAAAPLEAAPLLPQLPARAAAYVQQELPRLAYELGTTEAFIEANASIAGLDDERWAMARTAVPTEQERDQLDALRSQLRKDLRGTGIDVNEASAATASPAAESAAPQVRGRGRRAAAGLLHGASAFGDNLGAQARVSLGGMRQVGRDADGRPLLEANPDALITKLTSGLRGGRSTQPQAQPSPSPENRPEPINPDDLRLGPDDDLAPEMAEKLLRLKREDSEAFNALRASYSGRQNSQFTDYVANQGAATQQGGSRRTAREFASNVWADRRVKAAAAVGLVAAVGVGIGYLVTTKDSSPLMTAIHSVTPSGSSSGHASSLASQLPTPSGTSTAHNLASAAPAPSSSNTAHSLASSGTPKPSHSALASATPNHAGSGSAAPLHSAVPKGGHASSSPLPSHVGAPGIGGDLPSHNLPPSGGVTTPPIDHVLHLTRQTNAETPWQVLRNAGFTDEDIRKAAKKARAAHAIKQTLLPGGNPNRYFWSTASGSDSTNDVINSIKSFLPR